jgi:hypothetical protein
VKCVLCNQRKGKRFCPAKRALICAQCCGEKRVVEIDCPETCQYLVVGRAHEAELENARHLQSSDPRKREARARVLEHFEAVVARLEYVVGQRRRAARDLKDNDVAEALDLLLTTYRTEDKGVLYEAVAGRPGVEALRRELRDAVESMRHPKDTRYDSLRLADAIACLEFIRDLVASHIETRRSGSSYVDFLLRMVPRESAADRAPLIVVPGQS